MRVDVQRWTVEAGERVADQGCVDFHPITARQSGLAHPTSRPRSRAKLDDSRSSTPVRHRPPTLTGSTWRRGINPIRTPWLHYAHHRQLACCGPSPRPHSLPPGASRAPSSPPPSSRPERPSPSPPLRRRRREAVATSLTMPLASTMPHRACTPPPQAVFLCPAGDPS